MTTLEIRERKSHELAVEIDRLAYLIDPFEYWDVVGRDEDDILRHVSKIQSDLLIGNEDAYADWLWELSEDANLSDKDRERARDRLYRLINFAMEV